MSTVTPSRPMPARPMPARPAPAAPGRGAAIDPFRLLRRHLVLLIAVGVLGAGLGVGTYILLLIFFPLSTGEVIFEVRPGLSDAGDVATQDPLNDEDVYRISQTQLVLMVSREVMTSAVGNPDVQNKTDWFQTRFIDENGTPLVAEAVDELVEDVRTSVMRGTELFQIRWATNSAKDVPIVLNAIARAYMDKRKALDNQVYNQNLELFNRQLAQTNLDLQDLDQEIGAFIIDADITSLEDPRYGEAATTIRNLILQIGQTTQALSMAQSNYQQTAAKLQGTMEPGAQDTLEAEMDFAVATHIRAVESMKMQVRAAREKFHADHPSVIDGEMMLRAAQAEREDKTEEIIRRNLNAKLKAYGNEVETWQKMLEGLEAEREAKGKQASELAAQQSKFDALRERRQHLEEARDGDRQLIKAIQLMRLRTDAERVAIAQEARTPREISFPKPEIIVPLCTLLIVGLTVGIVLLREITDQRIRSASDLMLLPGARLLGVIPDLEEDPTKCPAAELVLRRHPTSVLAESYRQVCTPFAKGVDHVGHQTVVMIGGIPGAGTTTVVGNIAVGFAATGRRVLVVDANFRRPRIAAMVGLDPDQPGLGDLLAGETTVPQAVTETEDGIHVITAGTPENRIIDRLNSEKFDSVVAELRGQYELILFDAPPAIVAGDAMMLANKLDAAALVVRANEEQRGLVARIISQLRDAHCDLVGIVLNRPLGTAGGYFKKNFATMAEYAVSSTDSK